MGMSYHAIETNLWISRFGVNVIDEKGGPTLRAHAAAVAAVHRYVFFRLPQVLLKIGLIPRGDFTKGCSLSGDEIPICFSCRVLVWCPARCALSLLHDCSS